MSDGRHYTYPTLLFLVWVCAGDLTYRACRHACDPLILFMVAVAVEVKYTALRGFEVASDAAVAQQSRCPLRASEIARALPL